MHSSNNFDSSNNFALFFSWCGIMYTFSSVTWTITSTLTTILGRGSCWISISYGECQASDAEPTWKLYSHSNLHFLYPKIPYLKFFSFRNLYLMMNEFYSLDSWRNPSEGFQTQLEFGIIKTRKIDTISVSVFKLDVFKLEFKFDDTDYCQLHCALFSWESPGTSLLAALMNNFSRHCSCKSTRGGRRKWS